MFVPHAEPGYDLGQKRMRPTKYELVAISLRSAGLASGAVIRGSGWNADGTLIMTGLHMVS